MRHSASSLPALALACALWSTSLSGPATGSGAPTLVTLSVVGAPDLHGFVFPGNGRGGLALLAGFLKNLRAARGGRWRCGAALLDAGDTFQGASKINLSEGALVVTTPSTPWGAPRPRSAITASTSGPWTPPGRGRCSWATRERPQGARGPGKYPFTCGEPD